ncbi:MAG: hypothetical protein Q8N26_15305 [Myxococcales bacterium]|nr:hypothetical protein [Myxococcales bacterium]
MTGLVTAMLLSAVPTIQQDARGVFADGAGFRLRVNVVSRPSLHDHEQDPNRKPDPTLFTAAGDALKKAWPAYETLFTAFVSAKHPYRSSFQTSLTKSGQAVLEQGETLQTLRLERQLGIPMTGEDEFLVDPTPELSINLHFKDNPTYRFANTLIVKLGADLVSALPFLKPEVASFCASRPCPTVEDLRHFGGGGQAFPWEVVAMLEAQELDQRAFFSKEPERSVMKTAWTKQTAVDAAWVKSLATLEEPRSVNRRRADLLGELTLRLSPAQVLASRDVLRDTIREVEAVAPIPSVSTTIWALRRLDYRAVK